MKERDGEKTGQQKKEKEWEGMQAKKYRSLGKESRPKEVRQLNFILHFYLPEIFTSLF